MRARLLGTVTTAPLPPVQRSRIPPRLHKGLLLTAAPMLGLHGRALLQQRKRKLQQIHVASRPESPAPRQAGCSSFSSSPSPAQPAGTDSCTLASSSISTLATHTGFSCHGCGVMPIVGGRYRSLKPASKQYLLTSDLETMRHGRFGGQLLQWKAANRHDPQSTNFCSSCIDNRMLGGMYKQQCGPFTLVEQVADSDTVFSELGLQRTVDGAAMFHLLITSEGPDSLLCHVLRRLTGLELRRLGMSCQLFRCSTPCLRGGLSVTEDMARMQIEARTLPAIVRPPRCGYLGSTGVRPPCGHATWTKLFVELSRNHSMCEGWAAGPCQKWAGIGLQGGKKSQRWCGECFKHAPAHPCEKCWRAEATTGYREDTRKMRWCGGCADKLYISVTVGYESHFKLRYTAPLQPMMDTYVQQRNGAPGTYHFGFDRGYGNGYAQIVGTSTPEELDLADEDYIAAWLA